MDLPIYGESDGANFILVKYWIRKLWFFYPALMALPSSHMSLKKSRKKAYREKAYKEPTACPEFNRQADALQARPTAGLFIQTPVGFFLYRGVLHF